MSTELDRLAELAREDGQRQFLSIAHLLTPQALFCAFKSLRKDASAGVDGVTYAEYAVNAWENVHRLHERVKGKRYRAQPLRRTYIPKENGEQRPISIPALEDKVVQKATVTLLNAIYEQDFLPCSYGFRPGRSAQLMEMVERRVRDGSLLRLIRKWINAGVIDAGRLLITHTSLLNSSTNTMRRIETKMACKNFCRPENIQ